jgi:hypothetical protein
MLTHARSCLAQTTLAFDIDGVHNLIYYAAPDDTSIWLDKLESKSSV